MTTVQIDFIRRLRRAERDIIAVYGLLEAVQRTVDQQTVTLAHQSVLLNGHTVRLDRVETRIESLEHRLQGVEAHLHRVDAKLDEHGVMLREILQGMSAAR